MAFTSDLSLDEALLVQDLGFDLVDLVFGSAYHHIGMQWAGWTTSCELEVMSHAMSAARHSAMSRLERRLVEVDADGIVGMRVEVTHQHDHAHFVAIGTAIRWRGTGKDRLRWHLPDGRPFTSDLSGQELHLLLRAGYAPRAFVMGNCVYHVAHQGLFQFFSTVGNNTEMTNFTEALYDAREIAMERMQHEATAAHANGIVGAKVHEGTYGWGSHVIEFLSIGTAVSHVGDADPRVTIAFDLGR